MASIFETGRPFFDIREELASATAMVATLQQSAVSKRAEWLNGVALWAVIIGLIVGALGMNIFFDEGQLLEEAGFASEISKFLLTTGLVLLLVSFFAVASSIAADLRRQKITGICIAFISIICIVAATLLRVNS